MRRELDKRALFIVVTDYPGGAERISVGLASELASRRGWNVEVVVVCSRLRDSFLSRAAAPAVKVKYGPWKNWFLSFPLLPFRLAFRRYDLVFTTHVYTNALLSALRRLAIVRIKRLVMRESMSLFDRYSGPKTDLFSRLYRLYGAEDLLIAQTSYMASHVRSRLPSASADRLRVLPNPVDVTAINAAASEPLEPELHQRLSGRVNILFCGRFVSFKRPRLALEAFRLLANEHEEAQLVFMGTGPLESEIRDNAARLGLDDRVLFLGQRTNPSPVMAACNYGLLTSANEGFPNVVLEMMACGMKKIVMTPCAGDLESLSGVAITRTDDPVEIAATLEDALRSGENCSATYRAVAASRTPRAYVDCLLGRLSSNAEGPFDSAEVG